MQALTQLRYAALLTVVVAHGCALFGDDVDSLLVVQPDTVRVGDTFKAILVVHNHGQEAILRQGNACIATMAVFHNGSPIPMQGAEPIVCNDVGRLYTIPAHDSLVVEFPLVAMSWSGGTWSGPDKSPPLGPYAMRARMHVDLPDARATFVIVE